MSVGELVVNVSSVIHRGPQEDTTIHLTLTMPIDEESVGFSLPAPIRDFLFDIHEAVRVSLRADDVHRLYDIKYKEITDKYFPKSSLPDANAIASEVRHDQVFLLIYG